MKTEEYYIDLIYLELEGALTADQQIELDLWSQQEEANARRREDIGVVWALEDIPDSSFVVDNEKGWSAVKERINLNKVKPLPKQKQNKQGVKWMSMAAAVILLLVVVGISYLFERSPAWQHVSALTRVAHVVLPDQSEVWLHPGSSIDYPGDYNGDRRLIKLSGRAFFDVESQPNQPFEVLTSSCNVEVIGTEFEVWQKDSLEATEVLVKSGQVAVKSITSSVSTILTPGLSVLYDHKTDKMTSSAVSLDNMDSWVTQKLIFKNSSIIRAIEDINRHYKISIRIEADIPSTCTLNAVFKNESLDDVLNHLRTTLNMTIVQDDSQHYIIIKSECE